MFPYRVHLYRSIPIFFFFFFIGRILLERDETCVQQGGEADLWVSPKDECVLRDTGVWQNKKHERG